MSRMQVIAFGALHYKRKDMYVNKFVSLINCTVLIFQPHPQGQLTLF